MRLKKFEISEFGPLSRLQVSDLADVVLFAGPNGVGKTNILNALIACAQTPLFTCCDADTRAWSHAQRTG